MVHSNMKWNISNKRGSELIHRTIINILQMKPDKKIQLQDLVLLMNQQTKDIRFHKLEKYNVFSKYIKGKFGGLTHFLDTHNLYELQNCKGIQWVILKDQETDYQYIEQKTLIGMDWVFV